MDFTQHDLEEFQQIYQKEFGEPCTIDEAREMATRLMTLELAFQDWQRTHPEEAQALREKWASGDAHTLDSSAASSQEDQAAT